MLTWGFTSAYCVKWDKFKLNRLLGFVANLE